MAQTQPGKNKGLILKGNRGVVKARRKNSGHPKILLSAAGSIGLHHAARLRRPFRMEMASVFLP
jgi:hypothetical protein